MTIVSVTVDDAQVQATFARLRQLGQGSSKVYRAVSLAMKQEVYNAFRFQRSPMGTAWPGLSPLTIAARKRIGNHSAQPLVATGSLHASIEAHHSDHEAVVMAGAGLDDGRAWYNQFGTLNAPARPFFPINDSGAQLTADWLAAIRKPIDLAFKEATA